MRQPRKTSESGFTLIELMVVVLILGVVVGSITGVVISTLSVERNQQQMQDVIDDGRVSMERIRQELRAVRRVYEDSGSDRMRVWVDQNQNALVEPEEQLCFVVRNLPGTDVDSGQYQLERWSHADSPDSCTRDATPGPNHQVLARTLVNDDPFAEYRPDPAPVTDPQTREVTLLLRLEVLASRGPEAMDVGGTVRLRNVR